MGVFDCSAVGHTSGYENYRKWKFKSVTPSIVLLFYSLCDWFMNLYIIKVRTIEVFRLLERSEKINRKIVEYEKSNVSKVS